MKNSTYRKLAALMAAGFLLPALAQEQPDQNENTAQSDQAQQPENAVPIPGDIIVVPPNGQVQVIAPEQDLQFQSAQEGQPVEIATNAPPQRFLTPGNGRENQFRRGNFRRADRSERRFDFNGNGDESAPSALAALPDEYITNATPNLTLPNGEPGLIMNFRGASIESVLNYLSDAAGFIIQLDTRPSGRVDVWSSHPISKQEAVDLLNSVLNKNGYAAIRNGRKLTIVNRDDAIHGNVPVRTGSDPETIPNNDEIVTQIIPIRFVEAEQLVKDISPMVSPRATIVANAAGNSLVITDTQSNIRHLAEIIKAIDSSAEDETEVRVFKLQHADPAEMANLLTSLFPDQTGTTSQAPIRFGGGRFGPGGGGGGGRFAAIQAALSGGANSQNQRIKRRQQVIAVPDARTGSVVVTATKDLMEQIARMVDQLDYRSGKENNVAVFQLKNADPQQVLPMLQDMFQSTTTTRNNRNASSQNSLLMNRIQQYQNNSGTTTTTGNRTGLGGGNTGRNF